MRFDDKDRRTGGVDRIVLERGGKRVALRLPRHGVAFCLGFFAVLVGWGVASAAYVLFHDTVVAEIRQGAKASSRAYESEIAAMRDELERVRTRRMVEKTGLDERIAELGQRQSVVEKRQSQLAELAGAGDAVRQADDAAFSYSAKPAPLGEARRAFDSIDTNSADDRRSQSATGAAERVAAALDAVEANQQRTLESIATRNQLRRRTLERVYDAAGVARPALPGDGRGRGGPFEPLPASATDFEQRLAVVAAEGAVIRAFERGLDRTPIRTPSKGSALSSGFGARLDPFLGRPAFHAGLDFDGDHGSAVTSTAEGRVISAGWSGGYGNMVEVDHGAGLTTRYGHLSTIAVSAGDPVRIGTMVGRVGSTGRSTGPHLHYETRVNGEAVNPLRFLNAGRLLAAR